MQGRNSGRYRFINLEVELDTYDLREAEGITEGLKEQYPRGDRATSTRSAVDFAVEAGEKSLYAVPLEADGRAGVRRLRGRHSRYAWSRWRQVGRRRRRSARCWTTPSSGKMRAQGCSLAVFLALRGAGVTAVAPASAVRAAADVLDAYEVRVLIRPQFGTGG